MFFFEHLSFKPPLPEGEGIILRVEKKRINPSPFGRRAQKKDDH
jgi:hypothetical protein